ncbi:hypothetical protein NDA16_003708 [Ustilago loliicola]|nr:hypothetical protein NDA16_003708 [Ustilago loliicola]
MLQLDTPQLHNKVPTPSSPAESTHCCLPDANQDAATAAAPLDPKIAVQLGRFNLCLVEHPKLLVCTISSCPHKLPIIPTIREITTHLKTHGHAMVSSSKKALEETLDTLDLESPATVPINMAMLPVNIIKELPVVYEGYCCNMCLYTIKSRSAISVHIKTHDDAEVKARSMSGVSMQVIHKSGQNRRYLHVCNKGLDNAPLSLPLTAANNPSLTAAITAKVDAFLKQNHNAMEEAGMLDKGIQPKTFTGNINWPGAHSDFVHWLMAMARHATYCWMTGLLQAGCQVQQTFHAIDSSPSQPYDLSDATICKRADLWSFALALLVHVCFDSVDLGYYGEDDQEQHLGLDVNLEAMLLELKDQYNMVVNVDGVDHFTDADVLEDAASLVCQASLNLMMQQPEVYGQTEQLTLVRMFALCAVLHSHLLDAENGMIIAKPMQIINTEVEKYMKCYLHHDSGTASAHLQSLLCYGRVLSKDDGSNFAFGWSKDRDTACSSAPCMRS